MIISAPLMHPSRRHEGSEKYSTLSQREIVLRSTRDIRCGTESLRRLIDAKICFIAVQMRHQTSQTAQVVAWSDLTRAVLPRPSSSTCESRSRQDVTTSCIQIIRDARVWEEMLYWLR